MKYLFLVLLSVSILIATYQVVLADTPCTPVYGGGVDEKGNAFCMETIQAAAPTPTQSGFTTPNGSASSPQAMTKGGLPVQTQSNSQPKGGYPVQPPSMAKTTPSTGPELFGLFALIPTAAVGWKLRKTAQK